MHIPALDKARALHPQYRGPDPTSTQLYLNLICGKPKDANAPEGGYAKQLFDHIRTRGIRDTETGRTLIPSRITLRAASGFLREFYDKRWGFKLAHNPADQQAAIGFGWAVHKSQPKDHHKFTNSNAVHLLTSALKSALNAKNSVPPAALYVGEREWEGTGALGLQLNHFVQLTINNAQYFLVPIDGSGNGWLMHHDNTANYQQEPEQRTARVGDKRRSRSNSQETIIELVRMPTTNIDLQNMFDELWRVCDRKGVAGVKYEWAQKQWMSGLSANRTTGKKAFVIRSARGADTLAFALAWWN